MPRTRRSLVAAAKPPPMVTAATTSSRPVTRRSIKLELPEPADEETILEGRALRSRQTKTPSSAETNRRRNAESRASTSSRPPKTTPVLKKQIPKATKAKKTSHTSAKKTPAKSKIVAEETVLNEDHEMYDDSDKEKEDDSEILEGNEEDGEIIGIMQSDMELEDVKPSRKRISKVKGQQRPGSRSSTRLKMIDENKKTTPAKKRGRPPKKKTPPKPKPLSKNITEGAADDGNEDDDDYEIDSESNKEDEEDEYEALEEDEEEDEKMLSDVELEDVKPKRKRISVAKGQLPGSHSRLKMIGENKRFKFRASACTNSKVTPFNVQEYLVSTRNARDMFFDIMSEEGCIEELLNTNEVTFTPSVPDSENLTKWLERSSVKFSFRTDFSPKKKHTLSIQDLPPPTLKPETTIPIFDSKSFEFYLGKPKHDMNSLLVDAMTKSPKLISNKNVFESLDEISKSAESRKQKIQAFFCGGPILSIKPAPLCTSDGYQVVAVTTVADEATWQHQPGMPSYIQFWKFSGLSTMDNPSIWFLLRIENIGTISDMCWCPFFHEKILIDEAENSKILGYLAITTDVGKILIFKINKEIGLPSDNPPVVFSTPVFVFEHPTVGIPHEIKIEDESFIDENSNDVSSELDNSAINESIASSSATTPKPRRSKRSTRNMKKIIEEPDDAEIIDGEDVEMENAEEAKEKEETEKPQENVEMEVVEEKENVAKERKMENTEVDEAPFICVDWSPFSRCKDIVAISATGWIIFFDLTEGMEAKDALYDISWESPPLSAKWISNNTIAVGFSSRIIIYYDVNTKERIFEDNTSRSVGTMVATQPVLFPGAFSYDAVRVVPEDNQVQYQVGVYQVISRAAETTGLVVPLPNKHIGQVFNLSICETSGIIGSVGCDGRLLESLNGRVTCRNEENDFACFGYRPTLQIIRHKINNQQDVKSDFELSLASLEMKEDGNTAAADTVCREPIISHDKVISSNWLEIRVGDATLIDQEPGPKAYSSVYVEKVTFDRRLESLTRVEFSKLTPGLAITGGEAGIVFIIPTSL